MFCVLITPRVHRCWDRSNCLRPCSRCFIALFKASFDPKNYNVVLYDADLQYRRHFKASLFLLLSLFVEMNCVSSTENTSSSKCFCVHKLHNSKFKSLPVTFLSTFILISVCHLFTLLQLQSSVYQTALRQHVCNLY